MSFMIKHSLKDKEVFFRQLFEKFRSIMAVEVIDETRTAGNKPITKVRITDKIETPSPDRPKIYIQCLIHGSK